MLYFHTPWKSVVFCFRGVYKCHIEEKMRYENVHCLQIIIWKLSEIRCDCQVIKLMTPNLKCVDFCLTQDDTVYHTEVYSEPCQILDGGFF